MGGPEMAPHTPHRSERPGTAGALLDTVILRRLLATDVLIHGIYLRG